MDAGRTPTPATPAAPDALAARLDALVDAAPGVPDLLHHRLGALAARRWRTLGREVPAALAEEERFAAIAEATAPVALERVRAAWSAPIVLLKGPEIACRYPYPQARPYRDLDLLVEDPAGAQRALLAAGCRPHQDTAMPYHEAPLMFGDLPLVIELHRAPKWPAGAGAPRPEALLAAAVPSAWAEGRVLVPAPSRHAVLVAVHAWAHQPLRRVLDLVDVSVLLRDGDRAEAADAAREWGVDRLWAATLAAADAVLADGPRPWPLRTWAKDLPSVRERTVLETLLERWLAPFAALPPSDAARATAATAAGAFLPAEGETWAAKLRRSTRTLRRAAWPASRHWRA